MPSSPLPRRGDTLNISEISADETTATQFRRVGENSPIVEGQVQEIYQIPEYPLPPGTSFRPGQPKYVPKVVNIEGVGEVGDVLTIKGGYNTADKNAGEGNWVVVLHDYVASVDGNGRIKGSVVRISQLIPTWGDAEQLETTKLSIRRLLDLQAIRMAADYEANQGLVNVTLATESPEVQRERARVIELEKQIAALKNAGDAQLAVSPQLAAKQTDPNAPDFN